jgi:hypothetical protein
MTTYIKVADPSALVRQAQSTMARNRYEADEQRVQAQTLRPELSPERARQLATVSDADAGVISVPRRQVRFRRDRANRGKRQSKWKCVWRIVQRKYKHCHQLSSRKTERQ